jgi:protein-tyrosine phosphatase
MRVKGRGAPNAAEPWNEIVPSLWMGGHVYGNGTPAIVGDEFDVVLSLYLRDGHGPSSRVEHHHAPIPDGPLLPEQIEAVIRLAGIATTAVRDGRKVLVRCHSGYNRSGLVVAQALLGLGYTVNDAIFLIRYRRSKWALHNSLFVDYLHSGLDVARLLTGLDA